jgi:hypothetical protein
MDRANDKECGHVAVSIGHQLVLFPASAQSAHSVFYSTSP